MLTPATAAETINKYGAMLKTLNYLLFIAAALLFSCKKELLATTNVQHVYIGKYLLFDADEQFNTGQSGYPSPYTSIYYSNLDGSGIKRVTSAETGYYCYRPSWSPDGMQVIYIRGNQSDSDRSICIIDITGNNFKSVVKGDKVDYPSFSPDGTKLIYAKSLVNTLPYKYDLYVSNADGTSEQRITSFANDNGEVANIHCAPNGKIYFYATSNHDNTGVYSVNTDGSGLKYVLTDVDFLGVSPNGNSLLFDLGDGLYVCNSDGTNIQKILTFDNNEPNMLVGAAWSPDGNEIYFSNADYPTYFGVYRVTVNGYGLQQVLSGYYEYPQVF